MSKRRDATIMAGLAVGMTAVFCYVFFGPQQRHLAELRASVRDLETQLALRTADVAGLPQVEAELRAADRFLADFRTRIPPIADVGPFVEEVSAIAERLGLRQRNILPLEPQVQGPVTALPIRISFQARFSAVFSFLREIERLPRAAQVTELTFVRTEAQASSAEGEAAELKAELTLRIWYETEPAGSRV